LLDSSLCRTATYWGKQEVWHTGGGRYWLELESVQRRLNRKVSGDPNMDWVTYTLTKYYSDQLPVSRFLSLGCGQGQLERRLAKMGAFVRCDAVDLAESSVNRARYLAGDFGYDHIYYRVEDANRIVLPGNMYDTVWIAGALHHFDTLEHVLQQIATALRPRGLLVLNEYVGPNRFQFARHQSDIIESVNSLLPFRYRSIIYPSASVGLSAGLTRISDLRKYVERATAKILEGDFLGVVQRRISNMRARVRGTQNIRLKANLPTKSSVIAVDPSEAVRSADIVPVLTSLFDIVEFRPLGGSILQFLLADIAGNFRSEEGKQLLEMLFAIEDTLMATGDLESDFAYIVARPKAQMR